MAKKNCTKVGLAEKSKAPAGEKISGRQKQILQTEDTMKKDDRERCSWATTELYKEYHDEEWGKPVHDDRKLFEMLVLEGMQAGLSWLTILNKRAAFKEAFNEFDYQKIALYDETKIDELMQNPNIVRNRLKIKSTITNAQQFIKIQEEYGSFDKFIWSYVKNRPIHNHFKSEADIPATTPLSDRISKDLKKRGFKFVGSTIIYAYMQAIGIVNDHVKGCYLYVPE
jgi:DNA-3-methyladenine glycosylase I